MTKTSKLISLNLYQQTWPMLLGLFAIMGSQLVDSAFIGQLGTDPLAVVGFSIPVYQLIIGIQVGIGIATTSTISTAIGERNLSHAKQLGSLILLIGMAVLSLLCLLLWGFQESIINALGADERLFTLNREFWLPWLLSCWLGALLYFGYSICRAHGESRIPGRVMVLTSVINIVLDPIFIFTLDMGLAGAAWATCVSFLAGCWVIFNAVNKRDIVDMVKTLACVKKGSKEIIKFTAPAMTSQFIPPVSAMLVTVIVAAYGDSAVAAWGLASRVEYMMIILVLALTMALPPIVGKLKGQGKLDRILTTVKIAIAFVLLSQTLLAVVIYFSAIPVTQLLSNANDVTQRLQTFLYIVPISYGALGICMISVSVCNAMGKPASALWTSILRLFVCYLPLLWLGSELGGLTGLFIGASIGNLLSGIVGWYMFKQQFDKLLSGANLITSAP